MQLETKPPTINKHEKLDPRDLFDSRLIEFQSRLPPALRIQNPDLLRIVFLCNGCTRDIYEAAETKGDAILNRIIKRNWNSRYSIYAPDSPAPKRVNRDTSLIQENRLFTQAAMAIGMHRCLVMPDEPRTTNKKVLADTFEVYAYMLFVDKGQNNEAEQTLEHFVEKFVFPLYPYLLQFRQLDMSEMLQGLKFLKTSQVPIEHDQDYWVEFQEKTPKTSQDLLLWSDITSQFQQFLTIVSKKLQGRQIKVFESKDRSRLAIVINDQVHSVGMGNNKKKFSNRHILRKYCESLGIDIFDTLLKSFHLTSQTEKGVLIPTDTSRHELALLHTLITTALKDAYPKKFESLQIYQNNNKISICINNQRVLQTKIDREMFDRVQLFFAQLGIVI